MKNIQFVWSVLFILCITYTLESMAQESRKPRIQTSASPEETVFKPLKQKNAVHKEVYTQTTPIKNKRRKQHIAPGKNKTTALISKKKKEQKASKNTADRYWVLKTNLPADVFALHNLAAEMQVTPRISVELPIYWSLWDIEQEHGIRGIALQPEARWWTDKVGKGHYIGLHAHVAWYNVKWNENRYQDTGRPLMGTGLSYGYKLPLGLHWGAEFTLGLGYTNLKYNVYYNVNNGAKINSRIRHYWGLTRLGASLVYHF